MNLKEQILLRADENVIIKEKPVPKPKKKVKQTIKLKSLLETLLAEAVDVSDGSKVIRALERGQIPGVKKKVFLKTGFSNEQIEDTLNKVIGIVSSKVGEEEKNKYLFLIFKRAGNVEWLDHFSDEELNEIVDSMMAYFGNINKREAKEEEETKKKFEDYENSKLSFEKDKEFEQWANEKFAQKAKAKDDDIDVVFDDGEWSVSTPKTFAAAKKLACMANRKATWCTAASDNMFKHYTKNGENPLFIIRNEKKNTMFQMDWGKGEGGRPNFMDEKDVAVKLTEVLNVGIPNNVWKAIKNKDGESVYDKLEPIINTDDDKTPLENTDKTPAEELNGWNETVFITVEDFMNDVKDKKVPSIFRGNADRMRDVLAGSYSVGGEKAGAKKIAKYEKDGETYYHIVPSGEISLNTYTTDKAAIVLKDEENSLYYLSTNELVKTDLPKFFADEPLGNTERTVGDMDGWNEYIYSSPGEFLREIANYKMPEMIGDATTMTMLLKDKSINQIAKVSKGKNTYYYIIAKPGRLFQLGSKSFERVAIKLTGNKLTIKTTKSIADSDLPGALKEKLFTRYKTYPTVLNKETNRYEKSKEDEKQSISAKELKKVSKSEMPIVAFQESGVNLYTNVNTFGKIINVPNLGENTIDKIKKEIMSGGLKPADIVAIVNKKINSKKIIVVVKNNAFVNVYSSDRHFNNRNVYMFKNRSALTYGMRDWILKNLLPNALTPEEKKIYENIKNGKPIHTFKGGEQLVTTYGSIGVLVDGEIYYRMRGRNEGEFINNNFNRKSLSKEKADELAKQGIWQIQQKAEKLMPR